ncbi:MAG: phage major capsid protein, P2 family [Candidatus Pacearchaeota archaeon]|nr:phage major capsid protein, P2 family [Candidatus Pacearchaeota archaeon]
MKNETRKLFNEYLHRQAELNGVEDATKKFAATPSVAQTLESRIQETSAFLQNVNSIPVEQQKGEKIGLGIGSTIAGRTDTSANDRPTQDPSTDDPHAYECKQTNYDTHLSYPRLDMWAKFPDFQTRIRDQILRRQALDRIMIGWNGASAAVQTDRVANPLLQDVNIGWLAKLVAEAPARYMTQGAVAGEIRVGF